jgi:outer membrane lipopolysaccharide assembly protein LptE/RlpB
MSTSANVSDRAFIVKVRRGSSTSSSTIFIQTQAPQARDQHTLTIPVLVIDSATTSSQTYTITMSGAEAEEDGTVLNTEGVVIGMR